MLQSLLHSCCAQWTVGILAALWAYSTFFSTPVSAPGGPRAKRTTRKAKFTPRERKISSGWRFACDRESHDVSERVTGVKMTGESAGRQIWYKTGEDADAELSKEHLENFLLNGCAEQDADLADAMPGFEAHKNPNSGDKLFRTIQLDEWKESGKNIPSSSWLPNSAKDACRKAIAFYQALQCSDGHWGGDYGGPMFLMPGLISMIYITKAPFPQYKKEAMMQYILNHQQEDGGWGTHIESASTMFGSVLNYVALRLLGLDKDEEEMVHARSFIHEHGGALYTSSWSKFWLCVLGIYDWSGVNSVPAEMWYLPRWSPFHPGKLWCHCRMVYLPMCYLYCKRFSANVQEDPVLMSLRSELYIEPYDSIDWDAHRYSVCEFDNYSPTNIVMRTLMNIMSYYEKMPCRWLRDLACKFAISYIHEEDEQTNYVCIGPVSKALNMLSVWVEAGANEKANQCDAFQKHMPRLDDYLWVAEDGMKMQGYNGSQCWDTSFAIQGIIESGLSEEFKDMVDQVYTYLDRTQIEKNEENMDHWFRHESKGGWPFSTAAHGWPISDCTAEGLKGVLSMHKLKFIQERAGKCLSPERLYDAVNVILTLHNKNGDGGWATYENNRGARWYEWLNPSEVFGDIMIDYSYVECSSASMTALASFAKSYPDHRADEIATALRLGKDFIMSIQRSDGSWYGSWAVCFCYATWFGIEGLKSANVPTSHPSIQKAMKFLLSKQNPNGGWGEAFISCADKAYPVYGTDNLGEDGSGVVQTAWALLGLMAGDCEDKDAIDRGINFLMKRQRETGDWDQEGITGVFNRNCGITYTAYRNIFPIWALGRYSAMYEKKAEKVEQ